MTRVVDAAGEGLDLPSSERISGKGDLTRRRTVMLEGPAGAAPLLAGGEWRGQVLHVHGLESFVRRPDGGTVRCTTRRLLRTLSTTERHPVAAGDWVHVRGSDQEGVIQAIEPRRSALCRSSRGRRHVIVANVDQVLIVGSAALPTIKPALIDRLIVAAESSGIRPLICINKLDLVDPARFVPLAGVYARMGYPVVLCSAVAGLGIARLRAELGGMVTAVVGQSGVGKSSLLNALANRKQLARTSSTPGRTQLLNQFELQKGGTLVDLPGYGYAKAPEAVREAWKRRMYDYLGKREGLAMILVDTGYDGETFNVDACVYNKDMKDGEVTLKGVNGKTAIIAVDKHGNESKVTLVK